MEFSTVTDILSSRLPFAITISVILAAAFFFSIRRPQLPRNAPVLISGLPIVGSWTFFTKRWDFYRQAMAKSASGSFSFWAGSYPVVGTAGEDARKVFFESRDLHFNEGYRVLLGGSPGDRNKPIDPDYFQKRLTNLIKGGALRRGFPLLLNDVTTALDELEKRGPAVMDPFEDIYQIVFKLTMRTVGCTEIADNPTELKKMLHLFEKIEAAGDKPLTVMFPALWTRDTLTRLYKGIRLYSMIDNVVKSRKQAGRREDDALQYLLDHGDSSMNIVEFIMGALFAGQLNTGINAAWLIVWLSGDQHWHTQVLNEVRSVANKHVHDTTLPLREKLAQLPLEIWESEFPTIDMCLRESMRLNMNGTAFRRNISNQDITINKAGEVIPSKAFATYHIGDIHLNPTIYPNPYDWDPGRFLPDRAEDQKEKYAWVGWGVGRHPCLGMRFAKLEINLIVAFWMAYFESEVVDEHGKWTEKLPRNNFNANSAKKPLDPTFLKYRTRDE